MSTTLPIPLSASLTAERRELLFPTLSPAQIERQVAGSFVYGLSALFYGECTVKGGRMEQENFDTYDMMRISGGAKSISQGAASTIKMTDAIWQN